MASKVKIDSPGVGSVLKSREVASAVEAVAKAIASSASILAHDGPIEATVQTRTTDRAAASVIIPHPGGLGLEAVHGPLVRAAKAAGLQVKARPPA